VIFKVILPQATAEVVAAYPKQLVSQRVRKLTGWHAVLDTGNKGNSKAEKEVVNVVPLSNKYAALSELSQQLTVEGPVRRKQAICKGNPKALTLAEKEGLVLGTFNFCGLTNDCKSREVCQLLRRNNIHVCAGQETWETPERPVASSCGYTWFGKPYSGPLNPSAKRGQKGVGFFVQDYLTDQCEVIRSNLHYESSIWLRIKGGG
jgi:hypothetical protein